MIERERKFIVIDDTWKNKVVKKHDITQCYISEEQRHALDIQSDLNQEILNIKSLGICIHVPATVLTQLHSLGISAFRVRLQDQQPILTIKSHRLTSDSVIEIETNISQSDFDKISVLSFCSIQKERYIVIEGNHQWEVDVFPFGLVMAEIELKPNEAEPPVPSWCGHDVTSNIRYSNLALAQEYTSPASSVQMLG